MIYKFKSKATGDLIMLPQHGDALLRLLGREPAAQGIVEVAAMPSAIAALRKAAAEAGEGVDRAAPAGDDDEASKPPAVGTRQRVWPMIEMLQRAHAAGEPIVWGV